ncbi:CTLH/CRA C-terminal to lish motif domain-domain-containing protein [Syncephalastrum racemosum]|uniref:CTLH/CRA C-terminal to lish motif domain-domain-containing protein n=1 Tax=Syncephalastrum racemosum TaxID=13706 RepID=A0A1X2GZH1_SYNRA|nr:CTLH/CRA C-terminal to lish motif domain-domain-containing protein [Syncephalastrum racemosum]
MDATCRSLITEYLIHNCYKNTAKAFIKDAKIFTQPDELSTATKSIHTNGNGVDRRKLHRKSLNDDDMEIDDDISDDTDPKTWQLLDARKAIYDAVLDGQIPTALDLLSQHFPQFISEDPYAPSLTGPTPMQTVFCQLRCQQFVEIVRASEPEQAIAFAQQHLQPLRKLFPDMTAEVSSLIAYPDPHNSHASHLLTQERRDQLAESVNAVVLGFCGLPRESALERLQKQMILVESELSVDTDDAPTLDKSNRDKMLM